MSKFQPHDFLFADRSLERRIVTYLVNHGRPDLCSLHIRARGGVVRLRGQVDSTADRHYVLQGVQRVAGVIAVDDHVVVRNLPQQLVAAGDALGVSAHLPIYPPALLSA